MTGAMHSGRSPLPVVSLVNPLPAALHHYERELVDVLGTCELAGVQRDGSPGIEMTDGDASSRLGRAVNTLRWRLHGVDPAAVRLVLWPVFGLADAATWVRRRGTTWLIVHDPEPLRRQVGMGRIAAQLGGYASRHGVGVIVHSEPAAAVLRRNGWSTTMLPHPIRRPVDDQSLPGSRLTVLGQWKPARSLAPLQALAAAEQWRDRRDVVGRGWPAVAGWAVDSRFVSEAELRERIAGSACLVLPYDRYFQSNIAVRCLEQRRPVVGRPHPFLQSLYGATWPGLVEDEDWVAATARAVTVTAEELDRLRQDYWERCILAWQQFVRQIVSSRLPSPRAH
jgi:hypothetical protein